MARMTAREQWYDMRSKVRGRGLFWINSEQQAMLVKFGAGRRDRLAIRAEQLAGPVPSQWPARAYRRHVIVSTSTCGWRL